jgi:ribosome biogenesis GTPase A
MTVQWFPGHMHKARKKVAETMARVDMVIEVLDARAPRISSNPLIAELRAQRQRPSLKVLNKADLADPDITNLWLRHFRGQPGTAAMTLDEAGKLRDGGKVIAMCRELVPHRIGSEKPPRAMILGVPNVGKSTLINALAKRRLAKVADTPGVTQHQQRIELTDGTILVDTPGLMWPKITAPNDGLKLALSGAIGGNAYDAEEVAVYALAWLARYHPAALAARYKITDPAQSDDALFAAVAVASGSVLAGKRIDVEKTARRVFRGGILGRMSLEQPSDALDIELAPENPAE